MNRIAVFARPPVPGRVKTRLSPALPAALAAELYAALLADTLAAVRACGAGERTLWWAEPPADAAPPAGFAARRQSGADLGERLAGAFDALLGSPGDRAVVVGSDLPELSAGLLDAAFAALERHDCVLGPAPDGGYWLIGLARRERSLFEGVAWGSADVRARTLAAAGRAGLRVHELATLSDLDTPADLVRLVAAAGAGASVFGPAATAALRRLGLLPA